MLIRTYSGAQDAASWDILNVYGQFSQLGLQDNMVYDVLPITPLATGNASVNATIFSVDCGLVPGAHQSAQNGFDQSQQTWLFSASPDYSFVVTPSKKPTITNGPIEC